MALFMSSTVAAARISKNYDVFFDISELACLGIPHDINIFDLIVMLSKRYFYYKCYFIINIHSFIHSFSTAYSVRGRGGMEPISASWGEGGRYNQFYRKKKLFEPKPQLASLLAEVLEG